MAGSSRSIAAALALGFLVLHLPYPARSLEDLDSINFALGIRDFDVAEHQPHPPGYPLFILTAKAVNAMVGSEVTTLSLLGIVCGALTALVLVALFGVLDQSGHRRSIAWGSALLALTAPLMWITAARPLSDVPGLAAALLAQWLLLRAATTRELAAAALAAGVGAGLRSQVVWLTVPLILLAVARHREAWRPRAALAIAAAYGGGVLLWALPLLALSGGPRAYWNAVAFQGSADLSGVTMLWTTPTPRQFLAQIEYGFLAPWGWWPLAGVLLAMATVGIVRLMATAPDTLVTLAVAFGPYLVFNMLFQETVTTRYSLPLVVPIAYLATAGVSWIVPRHAPWLVAGLAAVALSVGQGSLVAQAGSPAPAFRMLADMRALTAVLPEREAPVLAMHRRQDFDLRRPLRWIEPESPTFASRLPAPPRVEWLELVKYWNDGGRAPVWFVADPLRSDLALVHHDGPKASYRWRLRFPALIGGVRPSEMDWYELVRPAWYLGEGWALTPEAAGVAARDSRGPGSGGSQGWIRRTPGPVTLMIGGRLLPGGVATSRLRVSIDDRIVDETAVGSGFFLRMLELPSGATAGDGDYAKMTVVADSDRVALEQFDAQPAGSVVYGFGEGWHESEYDPSTGESWRWTSDRSAIRVRAAGNALSMAIRGESESGRDVTLTIRVNDAVVATETVGSSFIVNASVPAAALTNPESMITIETDGSFVPAETRWRSADQRRLGVKILECRITPAS